MWRKKQERKKELNFDVLSSSIAFLRRLMLSRRTISHQKSIKGNKFLSGLLGNCSWAFRAFTVCLQLAIFTESFSDKICLFWKMSIDTEDWTLNTEHWTMTSSPITKVNNNSTIDDLGKTTDGWCYNEKRQNWKIWVVDPHGRAIIHWSNFIKSCSKAMLEFTVFQFQGEHVTVKSLPMQKI